MEVRIDKIDYFVIDVGKTFIELENFENLRKNLEKIRKFLEECKGNDCWIDATESVRIGEFDKSCNDFEIDGVMVTNCTSRNVMDDVKSLGIKKGSVWVSEGSVHVIEEFDKGSIDVEAPNFDGARELLKRGGKIFEHVLDNYPDAEKIEIDVNVDGCQADVYVGDVRFVVPCDKKVDLVLPDGMEVDVVVLNSDVPRVAGVKRVGNVLYHLFMIPVDRVDELIERWREVAEKVGADEFEILENGVFVLEPALVGVRDGELQYYIESKFDLEFAKKFFDVMGLRDKFDKEMQVIARLLDGFDEGLLDEYR